MNRRLTLLALAGTLLLALASAAPAHAASGVKAPAQPAPPIVWPQEPCNLEHRMDIAIVDGMFFECQCLRLLIGYQCDWYLVAGVNSRPVRKVKRPGKGILIRVARPAVHA